MRPIRLVLLAVFTLPACLTETTECPPEHKRMRGLCLLEDGSTADGGGDDGGEIDDTDGGDAGAAIPTACYLDFDHDGVGGGEEVDCDDPFGDLPDLVALADDGGVDGDADIDSGADASTADGGPSGEDAPLPAVSERNDDCDDHNPLRAPTLEELCDGVDNNCDDEVDEDVLNACGGECIRPLAHQPGEACTNGLLGACAREGVYACEGETEVACDAPDVAPSSELCGDDIDNDCDGIVDEPAATNALVWYQDCDRDGYAANGRNSIQACSQPEETVCGWTSRVPDPDRLVNWDCDDADPAYGPEVDYGLPPVGSNDWDLNCDGNATPLAEPTKEQVFPCSVGIVAHLNQNDISVPCFIANNRYVWDGCIVWKRDTGKFSSVPPSKCPDDTAYRITATPFQYDTREDPNRVYACMAGPTAPVWPCR